MAGLDIWWLSSWMPAPGYEENLDSKGYVKVYPADKDGGNRKHLARPSTEMQPEISSGIL